MNQRFDTILKSGTVVNQDGEGIRDIGISNGRIAAIGGLGQASAGETIDCKGLHILPGVIDTPMATTSSLTNWWMVLFGKLAQSTAADAEAMKATDSAVPTRSSRAPASG